jgi:TP901 family phage tail tape measure protein
MADAVLKADAAITAMAGATIAYAVTQYASLEDQLLKVKGILRASDTEYEQLAQTVRELGASTRYTAQEAAEGLQFLAMAGLDVDESIGALPNVLQLAQASATDLGRSADIVTNIMAGYGIEVDDLTRATDVLTATFTNSNTDLNELGNAFKMVGPVAKSLGIEIEDTSAILGTLANAGYKAEMGGTALRNILIALVAPAGNMGKLMKELGVDTQELGIDTASSAAALKSLGVNVRTANGDLLPFGDILAQLKTGLDQIPSSADRSAALIEIFGKRGGPQMAALLEQGAGAVTGLAEKIRSLGGVTADIAEEMESGIGGELRRLRSQFQTLTTDLGAELATGVGPVAAGIREVMGAIDAEVNRGGDGAFGDLFDEFDDLGNRIYEFLLDIAESLPEAFEDVDFSGLIDALGDLGDQLVAFFGMEGTDPADVSQAIQTVIDVLTTLTHVTSGIAQAFEPYFQALAQAAAGSGKLSEQTAKDFGEIIGNAKAIADFGLKVVVAFNGMDKAGTDWKNTLVVAFNTVAIAVDGVEQVINAFSFMFLNVVDSMLTGARHLDNLTPFHPFREDIDETQAKIRAMKRDLENGMLENEQEIINEWKSIKQAMDDVPDEKNTTYKMDTDQAKQDLADTKSAMDGLPEEKASAVIVDNREGLAAIREFDKSLDDVPEEKASAVTIDNRAGLAAIREFDKSLDDQLHDRGIEVTVNDDGSIEIVSTNLDNLPDKKSVDIEVTGEDRLKEKLAAMEQSTDLTMARIKAGSEIVQTQLEWSAKLDIAQVEASAEQVMAIAKGLGEAWESSGDVMSSAFSALADLAGSSRFSDVMDLAEDEQRVRERLLELQEDQTEQQKILTEAQAAYLAAKAASLRSGEALVTVDGSGLAPHLENIMWEIFSAIQIRVSEEGLDALVGVT